MKNKYNDFSIEELAADQFFQEWVLQPTADHEAFWNAYLEENPSSEDLIGEAKVFVQTIQHYFAKEEVGQPQLAEQFMHLEERAKIKPSPKPKQAKTRQLITRRIAIAASILIILSLCTWIWFDQQHSLKSYITNFSEWKNIELPDGSKVNLNANSKISFAENWKENELRQVWLSGEAFFQVEKKPVTGVKFQVVTDELTVEVLGTSFNVHSRTGETQVFLEEGLVKLELEEQEEVNMEPGDLFTYSSQQQKKIKSSIPEAALKTSWKDGVLILKDKTVAQIFEKVEEIYGVKVKVDDQELLNTTTTIRIPMDKLELSIPIMETALNVSIKLKDNLLIIQ